MPISKVSKSKKKEINWSIGIGENIILYEF